MVLSLHITCSILPTKVTKLRTTVKTCWEFKGILHPYIITHQAVVHVFIKMRVSSQLVNTCEAVLLWCGRMLMYLQPTQQMFSTGRDQPHTWRSFCFMYSQILLTTADRGNALSPVPRNFTRASERGVGLRKPEVPPFCCFFFLFGSSESTWN